MQATNHPFIVIESEVRGKSPIIKGTGMKVLDIVIEYAYKGYSIDQILDYHPHITLPQIHDALSYYYEYQNQFDEQIRTEQEMVKKLKKQLSGNRMQQVSSIA